MLPSLASSMVEATLGAAGGGGGGGGGGWFTIRHGTFIRGKRLIQPLYLKGGTY